MSTTREIISTITDNLNRPFDTMLYERIRLLVIAEANKLIRQQIQKNGFDSAYIQRYTIALTQADISLSSTYPIKIVLRTVSKIHEPIRIGGIPFKYVGAVDSSYPFMYKEPHEALLQSSLPLIGNGIIYSYDDGYIWVYNTLMVKEIAISASHVFKPISPNIENTDGIQFTDDDIFPAPADMIADIIEIVTKKLMNNIDANNKIEDTHSDNR